MIEVDYNLFLANKHSYVESDYLVLDNSKLGLKGLDIISSYLMTSNTYYNSLLYDDSYLLHSKRTYRYEILINDNDRLVSPIKLIVKDIGKSYLIKKDLLDMYGGLNSILHILEESLTDNISLNDLIKDEGLSSRSFYESDLLSNGDYNFLRLKLPYSAKLHWIKRLGNIGLFYFIRFNDEILCFNIKSTNRFAIDYSFDIGIKSIFKNSFEEMNLENLLSYKISSILNNISYNDKI